MAHHSAHQKTGTEGHGLGVKAYIMVFVFLLIMTGLTTWIAYFNLGVFNPVVAIVIAVMKAVAVILIFMHVLESSRLTKLTVVCGFFFLLVLLTLTSIDFMSRPWSAPSVRLIPW
jgi:cytochrome c oxidase subunit IV